MALTTFPAGETISKFSPVVVSSGGFLFNASANTLATARVTGLALDSGAPNDLIRVQTDNIVNNVPGLTPGEKYYVSPVSGTLASGYAAWAQLATTFVTSTAYLTSVGTALTGTDLVIEIEQPISVNSSGLI